MDWPLLVRYHTLLSRWGRFGGYPGVNAKMESVNNLRADIWPAMTAIDWFCE